MAELSLKERLQPALLDRLIDDSRYLSTYRFTLNRDDLVRLGVTLPDLYAILAAQGLRRHEDDPHDSREKSGAENSGETALVLNFAASGTALSPAQLKLFVIRPPGAPQGVTLQSFCQIESSASLNTQTESADKRMISMRKLRESVQRDLGWLLNSASLDTTEDLTPYPHVARSVVNYGMPSFAGTALHSIDAKETAQRIREVIENFEPRLSRVQVSPEGDEDQQNNMTLSFRIEGELWGQPTSQHIVLQTSIDVESGDVRIGEPSNN